MMIAGSVTVASDETHTGTGLALARYEADKASMVAAGMLPSLPLLAATTAPYSTARPVEQTDIDLTKAGRLAVLREAARRATASAAADVAYLQANASARVTTEVLGRTPDPNDPGADIQPPAAPVDIPIV